MASEAWSMFFSSEKFMEVRVLVCPVTTQTLPVFKRMLIKSNVSHQYLILKAILAN